MGPIKTSMREAFEAAQIHKSKTKSPIVRQLVRRMERKPDLVRFPRKGKPADA